MTNRLSVFTPRDDAAVSISGFGWSKKPARNWGMPANDNFGRADRNWEYLDFYADDFTPTGGKR